MWKIILAVLFCFSFNAYANWEHEVTQDKMGRGSDEIASTSSLNDLNLSQPYDGSQKATLAFRRLGKGGNEMVLSIQKGQIICDAPECMVLIRADSEEPFNLAMAHPKDGSSNMLLGSLNTENLRKLKATQKITIELTIFQNGEAIVEFNTENNPFNGRVVYTLDEIKEKLKQKEEIPSVKTGEVKIGDGGFNICKKVVRETKSDEGISFIVEDTKEDLVSENYSESSKMVTSCKRGMKHILMEIYAYK